MAISYKINIGKGQIQVTGKREEEIFEQVSFFAELPCQCGLCKSKNIVPRFRRAKDYDFYELRCQDCRATFACGQKKEGGLYPRGSQEKGHEGEWEVEYQSNGGGGGRDDRNDRRDDRNDRGRNQDRGDRGGQQEQRPRGGSGTNRQTDPADDDDIPF